MAKITAFRVDSAAIEAGEWVRPGEEYDDLEIKTRGFTDVYEDAKNAALRRAAQGFNGDVSKVPQAIRRSIIVEKMIAHVTLGVRNLDDENGQPIEFPGFCALLRNPDHSPLFSAALAAAAQVGQRKAADVAEAVGN